MYSRRRRLLYVIITLTSIIWLVGSLIFVLVDDVEVTLAVRRKSNVDVDGGNSDNNKNNNNNNDEDYNLKVRKHKTDDAAKRFANYDPISEGRDKSLPGELGEGHTAGKHEKEREEEGYDRHAFNQLVSDKISIYRSLKDYRNNQ